MTNHREHGDYLRIANYTGGQCLLQRTWSSIIPLWYLIFSTQGWLLLQLTKLFFNTLSTNLASRNVRLRQFIRTSGGAATCNGTTYNSTGCDHCHRWPWLQVTRSPTTIINDVTTADRLDKHHDDESTDNDDSDTADTASHQQPCNQQPHPWPTHADTTGVDGGDAIQRWRQQRQLIYRHQRHDWRTRRRSPKTLQTTTHKCNQPSSQHERATTATIPTSPTYKQPIHYINTGACAKQPNANLKQQQHEQPSSEQRSTKHKPEPADAHHTDAAADATQQYNTNDAAQHLDAAAGAQHIDATADANDIDASADAAQHLDAAANAHRLSAFRVLN